MKYSRSDNLSSVCSTTRSLLRSTTLWPGIVAIALLLPFVETSAAASSTLEEVVDSIAGEAIENGGAVGLSIGIAKGDEVLMAKGYGLADAELNVSATNKTVYRIGSITKQFTAAAILLLVEDGKISLDDPITRFLPDYPTQDHLVTIRHLLCHTSGIISFTNLPSYRKEIRKDVSHEDIIDRFKDRPFNFSPGQKFQYCNSGYYLLGVILENASGESYADFLQARVFRPLELKGTYYDTYARIIPNRAKGYSRHGDELKNAAFLSMTQPFSAGALASTVEDLILWQRALVKNTLLKPDSYEAMTTPGALNDGSPISYGLGLFIRKLDGHPTIRHGGGIDGFRSSLAYFPESDHTVAILANCESARPEKLSDRIAQHLFVEEKGNK